ncbi:MdtA/MuxA family multidrug efflux RND transporter periplasmic adaptor subunit [Orrella sp. JC864]|uniref:MdtA/MuxA family multidrug efflux RND transporter periplasmic adaptor subunit n=1 Tax=Orrella sp. JC864 TaxID=3120298 RepID=UPI003008693B
MRPRSNRSRRALIVLSLLLAGLAIWYLFLRGPATPTPPPGGRGPSSWAGPVPVRTVEATRQALTERVRAIGTVTPLNTVTVRSRVAGELVEVLFEEGQPVQAGQLLARIDPRAYQVQLDQALGQQQQNLALLRNAELDLKRYQTLFKQDSIARQQLDSQQALVRQYQGTIKIDQAQVDDARLQLSYTRITAPISGRIGLRQVDAGNLVTANETEGLAVITQTRPISVVFAVPEVQLAKLLPQVRAGRTLAVEAWSRDDGTLLATGRLATLDNRIDTATGTLRLRAEFDNQDESLFPNQFVNVRLQLRTIEDALTIPSDAVQYGNRGPYVYVVQPGEKPVVNVRLLTLGPADGGQVAVESGLQAGEQVVLEGIDRLTEGRQVQPVAATQDGAPDSGVTAAGVSGPAGASGVPGAPGSPAPGRQPRP